tara:strand:- start:741 stop:1175 length:435 start_codon:yes stop_codon:yes gene_type:complete
LDIAKSIIFAICIITVVYGIAKKNRLFFNYGYLIVGLLIVIDQIIIYVESFDPLNLALAALWLTQVVLVIPNKLPPLTKDGSVVAKSAVPKIMICLLIINFFGAYFASISDYIPDLAIYGHIILGIFPIAPAYFILTGKIETVD